MRKSLHEHPVLWIAAVGSALAAVGGCSEPGKPVGSTTRVVDQPLFAPVPIPPGFDRKRAILSLAQVPDDPPAPEPAETEPATEELPRAAARHIAEARRLFAEHRYTETILELEKSLGYNPSSVECHRMMAVACLMSGAEGRARLSAERALGGKPDDLACHYVLGRLADKADEQDEAIREYRIALKCPATKADASYRVLTHYRLGLLLLDIDRAGYLTAAIEQLTAFEAGLDRLGDRVDENPELATIARIHRGPTAVRVARAQGILGDYRSAAEALERAAADSPKDFDLRGEYIRMLVRADRVAEACTEASRLVSDSGGSRASVELLLAVHRHAGTPAAGAAAIEEVIAEQPENVELWLLYADALMASEEPARAIAALTDLLARHPDASEARWKLIGLLRLQEEWRSWLEALAEELVAEPGEYVRAAQELDQLPPAIARAIVEEGLAGSGGPGDLVPDTGQDDELASTLAYLLGRLCGRLDRIEDACRLFERSMQKNPDFLPGTIGAAELYVERCRWREAIRVLEAAEKERVEPTYHSARLLGQCHDGLDAFDEAVAHYQKAIELNRMDVGSIMLLGRLYERWGRGRQASGQFRSAIAAAPDNVQAREAYIRSLLSLLSTGDDAASAAGKAGLEFGELRRRAPDHPATIRCAALLRFLQDRDWDAYNEALKNIIQAHPDDLRSRVELATALFTARDYQAARLQAAEVLARNPRSPEACELMARALMSLLEFERSAAEFERILKLYPNRQTWIRSFAELRMAQQDYAAAIELWKRVPSFNKSIFYQAEVRGRLMEACRLAGRFDEAREVATKWLTESDPPAQPVLKEMVLVGTRWLLLATDQAAGDHDRYIDRCRQWLEAEPENGEIREWLLGVRVSSPLGGAWGQFEGRGGLVGAKRFDEAIVQVMEWLSETPDDDESNELVLVSWLTDVLQSAGRHDEAIELARNLLMDAGDPADRSQSEMDRLRMLQLVYARARRYDEAVGAARERLALTQRRLARLEPTPLTKRQLARLKPTRRGEIEQLHDELFETNRLVGSLLSRVDRFDDGVAHIEKMIAETDLRYRKELIDAATRDRRRADLLQTLAHLHQRRDQMDVALQRFREAYELAPKDVGLNNDLGYTLADAGIELAESERMIRLAVGQMPRQPAYLDSLGWVLYKRGKLSDAKVWLERATSRRMGEDAVVFDHLGDVHWRLGEKARAVHSWERSLAAYERQLAEGETDKNEKLVASVNRKLEAATGGDDPPVAPMAGEVRGKR